jgi:putative endonuclease
MTALFIIFCHCPERDALRHEDPATAGDVAICSMQSKNVMPKQFFVYIITNKNNTVLYTGVTSNLIKRIHEHKNKLADGFSKRYNLEKLVYYEIFDDSYNAIAREKQIKAGRRAKKIELIDSFNSSWSDLYASL